MRMMMIVKATKARSGVLLDASGLKPSSTGWRIAYSGDKRTVIEGPSALPGISSRAIP